MTMQLKHQKNKNNNSCFSWYLYFNKQTSIYAFSFAQCMQASRGKLQKNMHSISQLQVLGTADMLLKTTFEFWIGHCCWFWTFLCYVRNSSSAVSAVQQHVSRHNRWTTTKLNPGSSVSLSYFNRTQWWQNKPKNALWTEI